MVTGAPVASPDGDDCLVGVKLMGSYWFTESLGLMQLYYTEEELPF